jgi:hypothetical protein
MNIKGSANHFVKDVVAPLYSDTLLVYKCDEQLEITIVDFYSETVGKGELDNIVAMALAAHDMDREHYLLTKLGL